MDRQEYDHSKIEGVDADIETSLKEYGFAWIETNTEYLFYYGIDQAEVEGNIEHVQFDFCTMDKGLDLKKEYDWVKWEAVFSFIGLEKNEKEQQEWFESDLPRQINDLIHYYGVENIMGSSYWQGLTYSDIIKEESNE